MPAKQSAGILLYRRTNGVTEFFLVHPGGPFFAKKDAGAWSIPKGEFPENEDALTAARREFFEETGKEIDGNFLALSPVKQKGGKTVFAFAVEGNIDAEKIMSNTFSIEWPPRSGKMKAFPEVDKAGWFPEEEAKVKMNPAQVNFLDEIVMKLQ